MITLPQWGCVCVNLPSAWGQRVTPTQFHGVAGGRRECGGAPPNEAPPTLQVTYLHRSAPGPCSGQLAGPSLSLIFHLIFVLRHSFVSGVARGRNHTPHGSSHLVFVCHSCGLAYVVQKLSFHFRTTCLFPSLALGRIHQCDQRGS